jgi:hypothetical protein
MSHGVPLGMTGGTKGGAQRARSLRPRCFGVVDPETATPVYLSIYLPLRMMTTTTNRLSRERYKLLSFSIVFWLVHRPSVFLSHVSILAWISGCESLNLFLSFFVKNQVSRFNKATSHNYVPFRVILILVVVHGRLEKFVVCLLMISFSFREGYVRFEEVSWPTSSQ